MHKKVNVVNPEHLKEIETDAKARFKLYQDVFCSDEGQLLFAYMEKIYSGKHDFTNDRVTYFNLGMREVINQTKLIINKELK